MGSEHTNARVGALFTSGSDQKRTQGKNLWNLEGVKYFHRGEKKGSRFMIIRRIQECSTMIGRDGLQLREQT